MNKKDILYLVLLLWLTLGYLLRLDYQNSWGVMSGINLFKYKTTIFSKDLLSKQAIFFFISFLLISFSYFIENKSLKKFIIISELSIWLIRFLFMRGGYIVGFGGNPDEGIIIYDFVASLLRILLLIQIFDLKQGIQKISLGIFISIGIIIIKTSFFSL